MEWNGETYVPGRYIEDAAQVQDLALAYAPEVEYSEIFITAREEGKLGDIYGRSGGRRFVPPVPDKAGGLVYLYGWDDLLRLYRRRDG